MYPAANLDSFESADSRVENDKSATNPIMCGQGNFLKQKENVADS